MLNKYERAYRADPDFETEINPEGREMEALEEFRRTCGFGKFLSSRKSGSSVASKKKSKSISRPRMSTGSSVSSIHSKTSKDSSLDPIDEGGEESRMELTSPEGDGRSISSRAYAQSVASTLKTDYGTESNSSPEKTNDQTIASSRRSTKTEEDHDDDDESATRSDENNGLSGASTIPSRTSRKSIDSRRSKLSLATAGNEDDDSEDTTIAASAHPQANADEDSVETTVASSIRPSAKTLDTPSSKGSAIDFEEESTVASSVRPSAKTIDTPSSRGAATESDGSESIAST